MNCLSLDGYKTLRILFAFCPFYFLEVGLPRTQTDFAFAIEPKMGLNLCPSASTSTWNPVLLLLPPPPPKHWDYRRGSPKLPDGNRSRITVWEHPTFLRHILFVPNHLGHTWEIAFWHNSMSFECQWYHFVLSGGSKFFGWYCKDYWAKCVKLGNEKTKAKLKWKVHGAVMYCVWWTGVEDINEV